jgi:serine/threonine protein kinase
MDKIHKYEPLWGGWIVEEKIGEGSYGKVYRIRRENNGNSYFAAVKIITIPQSSGEIAALTSEGMESDSISSYFKDVLDGLVEEIDLLYSFRGLSNIVNIDDYKVIKNDDNISYDILIKMELLKDISTYVQSNPLNKSEVLKLAIDMCKALEVCHKKNIIHRDIKPDNIFISDHGDYKLGDFGVARKMEKTLSGLSKKGTYLYMAPEVYKGDDYDLTVDIYSLGIVIYRYLNGGKLPFFSSNQVMYRQREEALARRLRGEPLPYPESGQGEFESIILKACNYNPKERYKNIKEFKDALDKVILDSIESAMITSNSSRNVDSVKTDSINTGQVQFDSKTDIIMDSNNELIKEPEVLNIEDTNNDKTLVIRSDQKEQQINFNKTSVIDSGLTIEDSIEGLDVGTEVNLSGDESIVSTNPKSEQRSKSRIGSLNRKTRIALLFFFSLVSLVGVVVILSQTVFKNDVMYYIAKNHFDNARYEEASKIFSEILSFKDSTQMKNESDYMQAEYYFEQSEYNNAAIQYLKLSAINYKDSNVRHEESTYLLALQIFNKDSGSRYAKAKFESIDMYKESKKYIALIDDTLYSHFYSDCQLKQGVVSYILDVPDDDFDHFQTNCDVGRTGMPLGGSIDPMSIYSTLKAYDLSQANENRYIFARIIGIWESIDKKTGINVYYNKEVTFLSIALKNLKFESVNYVDGRRSVFIAQESGFYVVDNILLFYGIDSINEFAVIEFIDNNTISMTTKDGKAYVLYRKQNN